MVACANEADQEQYVYKSTLRNEYGLTPSMIDELGGPDDFCENPHYANAAPGCLYLVSRVEAWVDANLERLEKAKELRAKRSEAAKAAHARRVAKKVAAKERQRAEWRERVKRRTDKVKEWLAGASIVVQASFPATMVIEARNYHRIPAEKDYREGKWLCSYARVFHSNYRLLRQQLIQDFGGTADNLFLELEYLRKRVDSKVKEALAVWQEIGPPYLRVVPGISGFDRVADKLVIERNTPSHSEWRLTSQLPRTSSAVDLRLVLLFLRRIGWRGRKLLSSAVSNSKGRWCVPVSVVKSVFGYVPGHHSTLGPYLADCLDLIVTLSQGASSMTPHK